MLRCCTNLPMTDADRFIELETKAAYQEDALRTLNEVVTRQQDEIDHLEAALRVLIQRVEALAQQAPAKFSAAEEVPPHY